MAATCGLDFERHLSAPSFDVRRTIADALRELGFTITVDQLTHLEAKRGSLLGYSVMIKKQMPVLAVFEVATGAAGCTVEAHLADKIPNLGMKTWGVNRQYREIFEEIQRRVDVGLAKLDGAASLKFEEARFWSRAGDIGVLEQSNVLTAKAVGGAVTVAGRALDSSGDTTPKAWKGVDSVTFVSSLGVTVSTLAETQADLGVAVMIASHPGSMPANLARDVEAFAAAVEQRLTAAAGHAVQMEVTDAHRPVLEFLHQQGQIRSELPMRELHICSTCRLEKITNPVYERIAARNEKIGDLVAGVGATISKGGISPTFVLGQVFKLKRLDPDFVCGRCQGMEADERVVTFCPSCAELQRDVVLRLCTKCGFDFRTKAAKGLPWSVAAEGSTATEREPTEPTEPAEPAEPAEQAGAPEPPEPGAKIEAVAAPAPATGSNSPGGSAPSPAPPAAVPSTPPAATVTAWPTAADVPVGSPASGKRGKVCQMCRREYPDLWRVVIRTPFGFEERFVCGTSLTCQMPSQVPARRV